MWTWSLIFHKHFSTSSILTINFTVRPCSDITFPWLPLHQSPLSELYDPCFEKCLKDTYLFVRFLVVLTVIWMMTIPAGKRGMWWSCPALNALCMSPRWSYGVMPQPTGIYTAPCRLLPIWHYCLDNSIVECVWLSTRLGSWMCCPICYQRSPLLVFCPLLTPLR